MAQRLNSTQASVRVVGVLQEELRRLFTDGDPYGGKIPEGRVQLRTGLGVVLDGFSGEYGEDCEGLAWVTVIRRYRTQQFPAEHLEPSNCGAPRAILVQLGVARCAMVMGDDGEAPDPTQVHNEAIRGLDDAGRIDSALCAAANRLDDMGVINGYVVEAIEPLGPEGGVVAWVCQAHFLLS